MADQVIENLVYPSDNSAVVEVDIAQSATDSEAFRAGPYTHIGLEFPAAFTGATVTFKGAQHEGDTFRALPAAVTMTVAVSTLVTPADFATATGLAVPEWLKIVSASAEGAARTIRVHLKRGAQ